MTIMLNHYSIFAKSMGYHGVSFPTLTHVGYSSAAELFFLMSGYLVGLLYLGKGGPISMQTVSARLIGRASYLLAMNCLLFVCVLAIAYCSPETMRKSMGLSVVGEDPYFMAYEVLRLGYHIPLLGILNFYIIMMVAAVPLVWLLLRNTMAAIMLVVVLYLVAQIAPWLSLRGGRLEDAGLLAFNPLAWQVLFMGGIIAGRFRLHECIRDYFGQSRRFLLLAGLFVVVTLVYLSDRVLIGFAMPLTDKQNLGLIRVLHAVIVAAFLFALLCRLERFSGTWLYRSVSMIGRHSLQCFMVGVLLSYVMTITWNSLGTVFSYYAVSLAGIVGLYFAAIIFDVYQKAKRGTLVPHTTQ